MQKITAVIAALGFLASTSLTPVMAAASIDAPITSDDLSAAKKKAKKAKKKSKKKMSELSSSDLSAAKHKKAKKSKKKAKKGKKKMSNVIEYRIAA